jgi:hypothetical protein
MAHQNEYTLNTNEENQDKNKIGYGVIPTEIVESNEQNIELDKLIYGKKSYKSSLDINFSELSKKEERIDVTRFFLEYDKLFYNIPKEGEQSHTTIANRSSDYVGDFQTDDEEEIQQLIKEIQRLEEELAKANQEDEIEPEHPFFPNNSFLKAPNKNRIYFMEKGKKRRLTSTDIYSILKRLNGFAKDAPHSEVAIEVPESTIRGIPDGPPFSVEDLDGLANDRQQIQKTIITLDPTEDAAIKGGWPGEWEESPDGIDGYMKVISKEYKESDQVRKYLGSKIVEYNNEIKNRESYGITAEERAQLLELRTFTLAEIEKADRKKKKYAALYRDAKNIKEGIERDIEIAIEEEEAAAQAERDEIINNFLNIMSQRFKKFWNTFPTPEENLEDFFQDMKDRYGQEFNTIEEFSVFINDPILSDPDGDYDNDGVTNKLEVELGFDAMDPNETPIITYNSKLNTILGNKKNVYYKPKYKGKPIYQVLSNPKKLPGSLRDKFVCHYRTTTQNYVVFKIRKAYFIELESGQKYSHQTRTQFYKDTDRVYN